MHFYLLRLIYQFLLKKIANQIFRELSPRTLLSFDFSFSHNHSVVFVFSKKKKKKTLSSDFFFFSYKQSLNSFVQNFVAYVPKCAVMWLKQNIKALSRRSGGITSEPLDFLLIN